MYSIGDKTESSLSSDAHTEDECDSIRDTLGADRARDKVCGWDEAEVRRAVLWLLWLVDAAVLLPSVTALLFTVTKKLHKSVRVAGRADDSRGRSATQGSNGTSPNYNEHTNQHLSNGTSPNYNKHTNQHLSKQNTCLITNYFQLLFNRPTFLQLLQISPLSPSKINLLELQERGLSTGRRLVSTF